MQNQREDLMMRYLSSLKITLLFALIALVACGTVPTPESTLEPASEFVKGISEVPQGQYLFVQSDLGIRCSDASHCPCPAVGPIRPAYYYSSGILRLSLLDDRELDTNWSVRDLPSSAVGFLGYGQSNGHIYTIASLPYESPDKQVVIYSVDSQGKIAAEVFGKTYFFKPGQSWVESTNAQLNLPKGCYYVYTYQVTNYGLLTQHQIENDNKR